jgi:hypothetical protein
MTLPDAYAIRAGPLSIDAALGYRRADYQYTTRELPNLASGRLVDYKRVRRFRNARQPTSGKLSRST